MSLIRLGPGATQVDVFHIRLLMPYKETEAHGPNFMHPPPDLVEGSEEYEVEKIENSRVH